MSTRNENRTKNSDVWSGRVKGRESGSLLWTFNNFLRLRGHVISIRLSGNGIQVSENLHACATRRLESCVNERIITVVSWKTFNGIS